MWKNVADATFGLALFLGKQMIKRYGIFRTIQTLFLNNAFKLVPKTISNRVL